MPGPTEHKTVQVRILAYAEAIGWAFVVQKAVFVSRLCRAKVRGGRGLNFVEHLNERDLILKRKRRLREFPDTAFRPGIPSPERFIARTVTLSNPNLHEL